MKKLLFASILFVSSFSSATVHNYYLNPTSGSDANTGISAVDTTMIPIAGNLSLWLMSLATSAENAHVQEVHQ